MNVLLLVIGIVGVLISVTIALVKDRKDIKKSVLVSLMLIAALFLIVKEVVSYAGKKQAIKADEVKSSILNEIKTKVVNIEDLVVNLNESQLELFAKKIVLDPSENYFEDFLNESKTSMLNKSNHDAWDEYFSEASSLTTNGLVFELNGDHTYLTRLILIYLFTNNENFDTLRSMSFYDWFNTDVLSDTYFNSYVNNNSYIDIVLFKNSEGKVISYAHAREFTNEMIIYTYRNDSELIENELNQSNATIGKLDDLFSSLKNRIIKEDNIKEVVKYMVNQEWNEAVMIKNNEFFFIDISDIIKIK